MSNLTLQYVEPAACIATLSGGSTIVTSCALEPQWCKDTKGLTGVVSSSFVSSRQLHLGGSNTPGYSCLSSDGSTDSRKFVHLGRCVEALDDYVCTSQKENCKTPNKFEPFDELCTMVADLSPDRIQPRSFFSSCHAPNLEDEMRCFWSSSECSTAVDANGDPYTSLGAMPYNYRIACPCEDTEVGACKTIGGDDYFCAVSANSCDEESEFLTAQQLQNTASIDCRLCKVPSTIPEPVAQPSAEEEEEEKEDDTDSDSNPYKKEEGNSTSGGSEVVSSSTGESSQSEADDDNKEVIVIVSICAGIVIGLFLSFLLVVVLRRRINKKQQKGGTALAVVELADVDKNRNTSEVLSQDPQDTESAVGSSAGDVSAGPSSTSEFM